VTNFCVHTFLFYYSYALIFLILRFVVISFDRHTLVSLVLIIAFLLLITFPLFYVLKTCFEESRELTLRVSAFLEHNEQFQRLLSDYEKSEVYLWAKNYAASWGYDVKDLHLDSLRAYIVDAIKLIGTFEKTPSNHQERYNYSSLLFFRFECYGIFWRRGCHRRKRRIDSCLDRNIHLVPFLLPRGKPYGTFSFFLMMIHSLSEQRRASASNFNAFALRSGRQSEDRL
jgi:hypothetical protein